MTFYGKENESPKPADASLPLRKYTYKTAMGREEEVRAHYLQFTSGHVNFWRTRADDKQDTLVLSATNSNVHNLKEVTS